MRDTTPLLCELPRLRVDTTYETEQGTVRLLNLEEVRRLDAWQTGFAHLAKDHRYYEVVDETLRGEFQFLYLVFTALSGTVAIQPFFLVQQDLLATAPRAVRAVAKTVRAHFPGWMKPRMLMAGGAAGEGHPGATTPELQTALIAAASKVFPEVARQHRASLIIWKDFPAHYRTRMPATAGVRIGSMPGTRLPLEFASFEEYLQARLSHAARKDLRRKLKATREFPLEMSVTAEPGAHLEEIHRLYSQVLARSTLQFERLPPEFFRLLGERMPDRARFFVWRHAERLVACSICLVHDGVLYDEYLGLEYPLALERHLYFVTLRDVLAWAIANGLREYRSTPLGYAPKRELGFLLAPLDLYVKPRCAAFDPLVRFALPRIAPRRAEPILEQFSNAHELD